MSAPTTVSELIDWFEQNFICCVGPARAGFEIQTGARDETGIYPTPKIVVVYDSYWIKCRSVAVGDDRKLVAALYADFVQLVGTPAHETMLFWRYPEKIIRRTDMVQIFGKPLATLEAIEDGRADVPAGAVLGDDSAYYEDGGHTIELVLRTRLCIPAMDWMIPTFAFTTRKAEGAVTLSV